MNQETDIAIVGAGPVGALAALALHVERSDHLKNAHRVVLLDAAPMNAVAFERTLALSYGSRLLLERVGVWKRLATAPQPIAVIDVTQQAGLGHALIRATDCDVPALGYTLTYAALKAAMDAALRDAGIAVQYDTKVDRISTDPTCASLHTTSGATMDAALVVVADGGGLSIPGMKTFTREHGQSAVVAHVRVSAPRPETAFERFTPRGPIALLPLDNEGRYGLVWTHARDAAPAACALPAEQFARDAHAAFGNDLGGFMLLNTPRHYPLGLKFTEPRALPRVFAIGNAAQTMHPIAGQGLNLGFRDAWDFAQSASKIPTARLGGMGFGLKYGLMRARDRVGGVMMTETLVNVFGLENRLANAARGVGIAAFDALAPLKRAVAKRMIFGS